MNTEIENCTTLQAHLQ